MRRFNAEMVPVPGPQSLVFPETDLPVDVDCGCGVGWHVLQRAQQHPERFIVGVEHTAEKFAKFNSRIEHHPHLANLLGVHANAISWFTHVVPDESIDQIFFMYPNPNPKPSQANKRWHNMSFMNLLQTKLKAGGRIILATNEKWYAEEARHNFISKYQLTMIGYGEFGVTPPHNPRTHFEAKYISRGETCYQLELSRN